MVPKGFGAYAHPFQSCSHGAILTSFVEFGKTHSSPCICRSPKKERSRGDGTEPQNFNYSFELQMRISRSLKNSQNREIAMSFVTMPRVVVGRSTQACRSYRNIRRPVLTHSQPQKPEPQASSLPRQRGAWYTERSASGGAFYITHD